jgi:MFS family permease
MTFIVIADLFTPAERGKYQGYVGAVFGIASVLGPLVGGLLTDHMGGVIPGVAGWRWVFYVNVPVGGLALWLIVRRMPNLEPPGERRRPDLLGAALLLMGLVPLVLSLQLDKRAYPWTAWQTLALFGGGAALLVAFVLRSRRVASPILHLGLFANPVFRTANATSVFFGAAFMSITIFLPLFLVNVLGVSATRAGRHQIRALHDAVLTLFEKP